MKKYIVVGLLVMSFIISPVFVSAQTPQQDQTATLIRLLQSLVQLLQQQLSILRGQNVAPNISASVTVLSPNGGEKYEGGKTYDIKWSSNSTKNVDIGLIEGSKDSGQGAGYVALNIPNSGNYKWSISSSLNTGQYKIFIRPVGGGSVEDVSDCTFTITAVPLTLTNSEALALVKATWGGCTPD